MENKATPHHERRARDIELMKFTIVNLVELQHLLVDLPTMLLWNSVSARTTKYTQVKGCSFTSKVPITMTIKFNHCKLAITNC